MNSETAGIEQSNFFVVGIKPVGSAAYDFGSAELWETAEQAQAELEMTESVTISGTELGIFHAKVIGQLEKEKA